MKIVFEGQRVIVTGAGHGFGRAISKAFADAGAMIWACDLNTAGLEETKKLCGKACDVRTLDVADLPPEAAGDPRMVLEVLRLPPARERQGQHRAPVRGPSAPGRPPSCAAPQSRTHP